MFSNQLFTLLPKFLSGFGIECVRTNAFAVDAQRLVLRDGLANVAILAIVSADLFGRGNNAGPDRSGCCLLPHIVRGRVGVFQITCRAD